MGLLGGFSLSVYPLFIRIQMILMTAICVSKSRNISLGQEGEGRVDCLGGGEREIGKGGAGEYWVLNERVYNAA